MTRITSIFTKILLFFGTLWLLAACASVNKSYSPAQKFDPGALRKDYDIMREVLEKFHPALYWYTPKDSLDKIFQHYRAAIQDSMTEQQFGFGILAPVTTSIRCGHTSFSFSKQYSAYFRGLPLPSFPLYLKIWNDTMVVLENRNRRDSVLRRGTRINAINGLGAAALTETMFRYMPTDGYAQNINYIRLSTAFPYYHRNIFGLSKNYAIGYVDGAGKAQTKLVPLYQPLSDSSRRQRGRTTDMGTRKKIARADRMKDVRSLDMDSATGAAIMNIESFDNGYRLKKFYRQSFRRLRKNQVDNLVIDIRNNGGGKVDNYTALARYLKDRPFKVADTAFAIRRNFLGYGKYFQHNEINWIGMHLFASRKKDGLHHFRYWENHVFLPRKNKYTGNVYLIISGPTFSASALFCNTMKGQQNVFLVGEETGGGAYGNSGLMIPNITLPNTGLRVRIPLFRVVQYQHPPKNGLGIQPDIFVPPSLEAITLGVDRKMETVKALIRARSNIARH